MISLKKFDNLLERNNYKQAYAYLKNAGKSKNQICQALSLQLLSEYFTVGNQFNLDSVKYYLDLEKKILPQVKCDLKLEMEYYSNLSTYYLIKNDLKNGNEYLLKSLTIAEKLNDYDQQFILYSNLSILFSHLKQTDKMLFYTQKVRSMAYLNKDKTQNIKSLSFVADSYNNYYNLSNKAPYKDSVYIISKEILNLSKKNNYQFGLYRSYELMHNKPFYDGDFDKSLKYLDSAAMFISDSKSFSSIQSKATIYRKKHEIYLKQKKYNKAIEATDSLLKFAHVSKQDYTLLGAYKRKYETYKLMNDSKNALRFFEKFSELQDSVYGSEKLEIVNELEAKYNKVKNEKQILKLEQEKKILDQGKTIDSLKINLLLVAIVISFLILFLIVILYRQKNLKQSHLRTDLELKLNRSRINPHFFFNSLSAFQAILLKEIDKKKLLLNFSTFSIFMRQILESSYVEFTTIEKELKILENYMKLQLMRDENKFTYTFSIEEEVEVEDYLIPAMVLQPLIENSIEHGFKTFKEGGELEIKFCRKDSNLEIQILDNGVFIKGSDATRKYKSRSGQITRERFELLSRLHKKNFSMDLKVQEDGTKVTLLIPILYASIDR